MKSVCRQNSNLLGGNKEMAESHFFRTVTYGGYDKADVLRRIDSLNEDIFGSCSKAVRKAGIYAKAWRQSLLKREQS